MSDFVEAAINTADLASKLTGIAVDFLSGIGCEAFCEVLDIGKDVLFEAVRTERINYRTQKALANLDQRTVDDLKGFVGKELKKYSKKGKLPKKLKGKDLVDVFMNRLDTVSELVDDYAAQNKLSEDRKIALEYILNEIRRCTAKASLSMLEAEDKRLVFVISQIVHNELEGYLRSNAGNYFKPLFLYPTHCHYCESPHLSFDDERKVATCKNCGAKMEYRQSLPTDMQQNPYASFDDELKNLNKTIDQVLSIVTNIDAKIDELIKYGELKQRLIVAQDHIDNYEFSEAVTTCERIIDDNPDSVDALWCYLQAHYGIVYLKGYNDKVAKPTFCYALDPRSREQFCKHKYYLQIMTLLANDPERKAIYKARQKEIDAAIEKLKEDLRQRVDIDVFICVKIGLATKNNPDADPNLTTEDYENYAKVIYDKLKDLNLKPYCSRIDEPGGIHSDAQIWSAMMRSKKILIIGTCKEYLESVWVQCEWRRWLCMIEKLGCRKEETFISWIPVDDWVDQQPDEWSPYRPQICHTKEQVVEKILGQSAPTPLPPPIDNSRAIRDIRALLDQGKIDKAKKLLQPLLDAYPSSGELILLNLRIRTNNFKKLKKSTQHDVDTACKYLNGDPKENPEYKMYQKRLREAKPKRIGWKIAIAVVMVLLLLLGAWLALSCNVSQDIGAGVTTNTSLYNMLSKGIVAERIEYALPDDLDGLSRGESVYRIDTKRELVKDVTFTLTLDTMFYGKERNVQVYRIDDMENLVLVESRIIESLNAVSFQGKSGTYAVVLVPYVISFYDGDELIYAEELLHGETLTTAPAVPHREGYDTVGFFDDSEHEFSAKRMATCSKSYYAKRTAKAYQVTLDANGGSIDQSLFTVTYDQNYQLPQPECAGYIFKGFIDENGDPFELEGTWRYTENKVLSAVWIARTDNQIVVHHNQQDVSGEGFTCKETEEMLGTTNTTVTPPTKEYEGFTSPAMQTVTIKGDGTVVVEYYYTRNCYTLRVNYNDGTEEIATSTILYGATYELQLPERAGYVIKDLVYENGDSYEPTEIWQHTENKELTIIWEARTDTLYTVKHHLQKVSGEGFACDKTEEMYGTTDTTVTPSTIEYKGFTSPALQTVTIKGDGTVVVEYYYTRNHYTLHVKYNDGTEEIATSTILYGATYELQLPERANFVFLGWQASNGSSFEAEGLWEFTEDVTVTALWIRCFEYGLQYYEGDGVTQDYREAVKYFRLAAEQEDVQGQYYLGECYYHGHGVSKDLEEAEKWYLLAEAQGNANACVRLGVCYCDLGYNYYNGFNGKTKDYEKAVEYYRLAADRGNAEAQYKLGVCYDDGEGVDQDYQEAAKWFELSANQGHKNAQWRMGFYCEHGYGVSQDYVESAKWYRLAADQGYSLAQDNLGELYFNGQGVAQSYEEAVKWYRMAADQGYYGAQEHLGDCYYYGYGVTQSYEEAAKWYKLVADQYSYILDELARTYYYAGLTYYEGDGVTQDYAEAVRLFRLAADLENADAQYMLGYCYEHGLGVTKDLEEAAKWYQLAAEQGKAISFTYNIVYISTNGTELGSDTVAHNLGTTNTISPKTFEGYNTPEAQSIDWDSVSAKTVTFVYEPTPVSNQQLKKNAVWWWENGYGIKYSVSVEFYNRTADSVTAKITWTNTITNAYYGVNQYFNMTIGTQSTGRQTIATSSKWAGEKIYNGSATKTVDIVITGLSPTTTSLAYTATPSVGGDFVHPDQFGGTVAIPAY